MIIIIPLIALIIAQLCKVAIDVYMDPKHKLSAAYFNNYGGMPSAHSALFASLATTALLMYGWNSAAFAISAILYITQVRDAVGVRWHLGNHAAILKQLIQDHIEDGDVIRHDTIVTRLGHTPFQAVVGSALGVLISILLFWIFN